MLPVQAQLGDDMGSVLILVAANYYQAIVCGGVRRTVGGKGIGRMKEEEEGGEGGGRKDEGA